MNREVSEAKALHVRGKKHDPSAGVGTFGVYGDLHNQLAYLADAPNSAAACSPDLLALVEGLLPIAPEWVLRELNVRLVALSRSATQPHQPRLDVSAWCMILAGLDRAICNGPMGHAKYTNMEQAVD